MNNQISKRFKTESVFLLGISSLSYFGFSPVLLTQIPGKNLGQEIIFISSKKKTPPPSRGTPEAEEGTGSRGVCPYRIDMPPLTSLTGNKDLNTTTARRPSFWIYLPYSITQVSRGEFTLQDGENDLYRTQVKLPANIPGIIEIQLPSGSTPLEVGQEYRWYFEIDCSNESSNESDSLATLTGTVCLVEPSAELNREIELAQTPLERVKIFAKHGIWHETLAQLIKLRSQEPENLTYQKMWNQLLRQPEVDKTDIINASFVGKVGISTSTQ